MLGRMWKTTLPLGTQPLCVLGLEVRPAIEPPSNTEDSWTLARDMHAGNPVLQA